MRRCVLLLSLLSALSVQAETPWMALLSPDNSLQTTLLKDEQAVAGLSLIGWGPNWAWKGLGSKQRATGDALELTVPFESAPGATIKIGLKVWRSAPNAVSWRYQLSADKDVPLTGLMAILDTKGAFRTGTAVATLTDGKTNSGPLSFQGIRGIGETSKVVCHSPAGDYTIKIEPASNLYTDGALRLALAEKVFPAGQKTVTVTLELPGDVALLAKDADLKAFTKTLAGPDWFAFAPGKDTGECALSFASWLDKPAGKHGGVRLVGDKFAFADGTPVKFWGTNLSYGLSAPSKADADFTAARFAKWGVNAIRMHKFSGAGWEGIGDPQDATKMVPAGLDKLDYFADALTKNGVYYGWSHTFGFRPKPGNKARLLSYDEIQSKFGGNTYALINLAEDVQDLMIEMVVNLLNHQNPYTGKRYADDPALSYLELQNEDDIFFFTNSDAVNKSPIYRQRFQERWSDWLKAKYGTTAALKTAWGSLGAGESLEARNIGLQANPWFFSADNLPNKRGGERQRLLDNAAWYHSVQNAFYSRFVKAIRGTGYQGPICGSPWQAPSGLPHYYNLYSDYQAGWIDRHNYFGGRLNDTLLTKPGSGYLSTGLQQVGNRPFGISEWIHVYPSLYSAEGPALMAAYGMGLQGWDASYEFQSASGAAAWDSIVGNFPWGVWKADTPTQLGQYPLLARMVARGDVKEGPVVSTRRVSPSELAEGKFDFSDKVQQTGDIKSFTGSVPEAALAMGRCVVEFPDQPTPSTFVDAAKYQQGQVITSATGQLKWDATDRGFVTIDTAGTKALIGFVQDKPQTLGQVRLTSNSPYISLFVTASDPGADLATGKRALISAMARNCNTGFAYFGPDLRVLENGQAPILLEPVKATVDLGRAVATVYVLDHDGKRTERTVKVDGGRFVVDTGAERALWYEVVFGG